MEHHSLESLCRLLQKHYSGRSKLETPIYLDAMVHVYVNNDLPPPVFLSFDGRLTLACDDEGQTYTMKLGGTDNPPMLRFTLRNSPLCTYTAEDGPAVSLSLALTLAPTARMLITPNEYGIEY